MLFFKMRNGMLVPVAGRGTGRKKIKQLQDEEWAQIHGGITGVVSYTVSHATAFYKKFNERRAAHVRKPNTSAI